MPVRKTLVDYKNIGKLKNIEYLSETVPENIEIKVPGWKCLICNHEWISSYRAVKRGGCAKCGGILPKNLDDYKKIGIERGVAFIADSIPSRTVYKTHGWVCQNCQYEWETSFHSISHGNGCPKCGGKIPKKIKDYRDICVNKHIEYILDTIPKNAATSVLGWKCLTCKLIWKASYSNISRGYGCPKCGGVLPKTLDDYRNMGKERGVVYNAENVPQNTRTKTKWFCETCKKYWKTCYESIRKGSGCPRCCAFKSENECRKIFEELYSGYKFNKKRPDFLTYKTGKKLELDGFNSSLKLAFEYNGEQHYKRVPFFHRYGNDNLIQQQERDRWKYEQCEKQGIVLIQIPYTFSHLDIPSMKCFIKTQLKII